MITAPHNSMPLLTKCCLFRISSDRSASQEGSDVCAIFYVMWVESAAACVNNELTSLTDSRMSAAQYCGHYSTTSKFAVHLHSHTYGLGQLHFPINASQGVPNTLSVYSQPLEWHIHIWCHPLFWIPKYLSNFQWMPLCLVQFLVSSLRTFFQWCYHPSSIVVSPNLEHQLSIVYHLCQKTCQ